jgi:hypothetical protein
MTRPGSEIAAGAKGRGHLRASHADREQTVSMLKAAFVQGCLARDELGLRISQALTSRTYADLSTVTADLPAGLATAHPAQPSWPQGKQPMARPLAVITGATAVYAFGWVYEIFLTPNGADNPSTPMVIFGGFMCYMIIMGICVVHMASVRLHRRSGRQHPRQIAPSAGAQAR